MLLGDFIEELRKKQGLTQEELAARAGIGRTKLWKVCQPETIPSMETMRDIFKKGLRVSHENFNHAILLWLKRLLTPEEYEHFSVKDAALALRAREEEAAHDLARQLARLPQEHQEQILLAMRHPQVLTALKSINTLANSFAHGTHEKEQK